MSAAVRRWTGLALPAGLALAIALLMALTGLLAAWPALARLAVPPLQALATDTTGTVDPARLAALNQRLKALEVARGSQVAVLVVRSTEGEPVETYALRVAEQWKLGRQRVDDGVLLLVATEDRSLRLEVGYGLEGAVNDATARRIIEERITPRLREGDLAGGLEAGVAALEQVIAGEPLPPPTPPAAGTEDGTDGLLMGLFVANLVIGRALVARLGRWRGAALGAVVLGGLALALSGRWGLALLVAVIAFGLTAVMGLPGGRGGGGGGGGGGWGGGGRGGGSSGGGWGGGGGGRFGGGGASGRW